MLYTINDYEEVYNSLYENTIEEMFESLRSNNIKKYRMKTIKSGSMLECEIYPIWNTNKKGTGRIKVTSNGAQKILITRM